MTRQRMPEKKMALKVSVAGLVSSLVYVGFGTSLDVAAPGHRRLNDPLLGGDDLRGHSGRAGGRADLGQRQDGQHDAERCEQVQVPRTSSRLGHGRPLRLGRGLERSRLLGGGVGRAIDHASNFARPPQDRPGGS